MTAKSSSRALTATHSLRSMTNRSCSPTPLFLSHRSFILQKGVYSLLMEGKRNEFTSRE